MKRTMPHNYKNVEKLFCDQTDKNDYLCHNRKLTIHVNHGMEVTQLTRVKRYEQKSCVKNPTDKNAALRAKSITEFGKLLQKI